MSNISIPKITRSDYIQEVSVLMRLLVDKIISNEEYNSIMQRVNDIYNAQDKKMFNL